MNLSKHVKQRMVERNLTINDIESAINDGVVIIDEERIDDVVTFKRNGICVIATTGWDPFIITVFVK